MDGYWEDCHQHDAEPTCEECTGTFIPADEFNQSDWAGYWVYECEGGYKVWTYAPLDCEVEGMEVVK